MYTLGTDLVSGQVPVVSGQLASRRYNTEKIEKPPLRAVTLANDLQLKWLGFESQQVKVGRGERGEAYGEGRDEDCGSAKPRQGEALCAERQGAAISREVTRQSRAARIGDGLAESCLSLDRGRSPRPERSDRHDQGAKRGHD